MSPARSIFETNNPVFGPQGSKSGPMLNLTYAGDYTETFVLTTLSDLHPTALKTSANNEKVWLLGHITDAELVEVAFTLTSHTHGALITSEPDPIVLEGYKMVLTIEIPAAAERSAVVLLRAEITDPHMNEPQIFDEVGQIGDDIGDRVVEYMDPLIARLKLIQGDRSVLKDGVLTLRLRTMDPVTSDAEEAYQRMKDEEEKRQALLRKQLEYVQGR